MQKWTIKKADANTKRLPEVEMAGLEPASRTLIDAVTTLISGDWFFVDCYIANNVQSLIPGEYSCGPQGLIA